MSGASHPASSMRCLISGTAAAASGTFTVTRTISEPACQSSITCCAVALRVRGVRHRHRLHDDRRTAADLDAADTDGNGSMETNGHSLKIIHCGLRVADFGLGVGRVRLLDGPGNWRVGVWEVTV